jgi:hypothetical protein
MLTELTDALAHYGLRPCGAFHPEAGEAGLENAGTLLLVGYAGGVMWDAFAPHNDELPHPLDRWTRQVLDPIAEKLGARVLYPFGEQHWPFQRWAQRADTVYPSPLGILIHPKYGLWHAYRAALLFAEHLPLPSRQEAASPCDSCTQKPCLTACPVAAFSLDGYDVSACATHLASAASNCCEVGCHARNACPIGRDWRYPEAQIRFHMAAFARSVMPAGAAEDRAR